MKFLVGLLAIGLVVAQSPLCAHKDGVLDLPSCTDTCLKRKEAEATCGTDLLGFCQLSGGIKTFFSYFNDCLLQSCSNDADRYEFMKAFKNECGTLLTGEPDVWKKYTTQPTRAAMTTVVATATSAPPQATSSQNSPAPAPSSANSALTPTSDPTKPPQDPKTSAAASQPNDTQGPATQPQASTVHVHVTVSGTQPSSSSSHTSSAAGTSSSMNKGQVIGSAAGGTAAIAALIGTVYLFIRRHRRRNSQPSTPNMWSPDRNTSHKAEMASGSVLEKHSESGTGSVVGPAELHSNSSGPAPNERPMNECYPSLNAHSLTKSPNATSQNYYSPTTQAELDAISPPCHISEMDTISPVSPRSPLSGTSTTNAWSVPPTSSPLPTHYVELDTDRIASPVSEIGGPVAPGEHPTELHNEAAPPRYSELRGVGEAVESGGEQGTVHQTYVAYSPGAGVARNF